MKTGYMMRLLELTIKDQLEGLLVEHSNLWQSILIDYDKPIVERVYIDLPDGTRLSLHVIHPCKEGESFFHPHPWPSAIYIVDGRYEMKMGYSESLEIPSVASTVILAPGSSYEMINLHAWHSVRPLDLPSSSIMLNGTVWHRPMPKAPDNKLKPLSEDRKEQIMKYFLEWLRLPEEVRYT